MNNPLDLLARRHATDKGPDGHAYTTGYFALFAPLRERGLALLEIGVASGASLRMWEDFFPNARIFGIDEDPAAARHASARARIFIGDQVDADFLAKVVLETGPLDVVIDDGSHHPDHQLASLRALFPHLRDGGVYVIEDLGCSFLPRYGPSAGLGNPGSAVEYLKRLLDVIHATPIHGGRLGDAVTSRVRALHVWPEIAFLVKGAPRLGETPGDLRTRRPERARPLDLARSRLRYAWWRQLRRLRRLGRRADPR